MDDLPNAGFRARPVWLIGAAALVIAQAGLGLALFGTEQRWTAVVDDRPILSGRHPLHLYHGTLGAAAFVSRGVTTCYDPQFQAGYPKTPVFDGGSRPAELFLLLGGGGYCPAAYKLGLFAFILLVPVALVSAARRGLPVGVAMLSGVGGIVLGWSVPVQRMIVEGQLDVLAAGLASIVFVPWLARLRPHEWSRFLASARRDGRGWLVLPSTRLARSGTNRPDLLPCFRAATRPGLASGVGGDHLRGRRAERMVAGRLGEVLVAAATAEPGELAAARGGARSGESSRLPGPLRVPAGRNADDGRGNRRPGIRLASRASRRRQACSSSPRGWPSRWRTWRRMAGGVTRCAWPYHRPRCRFPRPGDGLSPGGCSPGASGSDRHCGPVVFLLFAGWADGQSPWLVSLTLRPNRSRSASPTINAPSLRC